MRLGVIGDVAATGFGRVTRELGSRLIAAGVDARFLAVNYRGRDGEALAAVQAGKSPDEVADTMRRHDADPVLSRSVPALSGGRGDMLGNDVTAAFLTGGLVPGWRADAALVVADPRAMLERLLTDQGSLSRIPAWNYVPVEGTGLTPAWRQLWSHVQPVAMSAFGARELGALLGRTDVPVVHHGLTPAFRPLPPERRAEVRAELGWTDRLVVLRADRHVPRKAYPAFFETVRDTVAEREDVLFVVHCHPADEGGLLPELVAALPGARQDGGAIMGWRHSQVLLTMAHDTWQGLTDERLNEVYGASDLYLSPTQAEGFGLTLLEAAAAGLPVVTTDFAAGPEAVGPGGVLVPPLALEGNPHAHRWAVPDTAATTAAVLRLLDDPAERRRLGEAGAAHAATFSWDTAALDLMRLMGA